LQIQKLSFAIIHSTTILLPVWCELCITHKHKERIIPRDVRTRWNSTYDMLRFAEQYREVIDAITSNKTYGLRKFELDDHEWKVVGNLVYVFKTATLFFSSDAISTISNVILTMDTIDDILQSRGNRKLQLAVLRTVVLGRATLQHYYQKTNASDIYRLALGSGF
ncbi:hypothetical protein DFH08DRAFT_711760, partial [Mycena albidolilacea]